MKELRYIAKTENIVLYKDNYYFVPVDMNYLFKMSKDLMSVEPLVRLNDNTIDNLYAEIVAYEDKLFLVPKMASEIAVYDLLRDEIKYFHLADKSVDRNKGSLFLSSLIVEDCLYLIPTNYTRIVCVNMLTTAVKEIPVAHGGMICDGIAAVKDEKIWIPDCDENNIIIYDIQKQSIEYLFPQKLDFSCNIVMDCGEYVMLQSFDLNAPTIQYYLNTNESIIISNKDETDRRAWKGTIINNYLYLITTESGTILKINNEAEREFLSRNTFISFPENAEQWEINERQVYLFERENRIHLVNGVTAEWYSYDSDEWKIETVYGDIKCDNCIRLDYGILPLI